MTCTTRLPRKQKDPDGGSYPVYPSGKSWDGKTGSSNKFFHNLILGSAVKTEPFYVAIIGLGIPVRVGGHQSLESKVA